MRKKILSFVFFICILYPLCSQSQLPCKCVITGRLIGDKNRPIKGQHIILYSYKYLKGQQSLQDQSQSNQDGTFEICVPSTPDDSRKIRLYEVTLTINYIKNYYTETIKLNNLLEKFEIGDIQLKKEKTLETPVPIDYITNEMLTRTGQTTLGRALHYTSPGLNSTGQPISDGSAHYDPTDFRNLGGSRTLILVNGKRKNFGAYLHVNDITNKGEVGVDIRSIPLIAIEEVKVERQEATTLYGSDAVGGILDFRLKERYPKFSATMLSGVNSDNLDGFTYGFDLIKGLDFSNKGFLTVSYSYLNQSESNRANRPGYDSLQTFITPYRDSWIKNHPSLGMRIGEPKMTTSTLFYNSKFFLRGEGQQNELYGFGGITYRNTASYANYRTPYWVREDYDIFSSSDSTYNGFQPTFESDARDHFFVFGFNGASEGGNIEFDVSQSIAGNDVDFAVDSSFNPALKYNSPIFFKTGGYNLTSKNTHFELDWNVFPLDTILKFKIGGDFRNERYSIRAGEENSYLGEGTISYPGTQPKDAITANRNNIGFFLQGTLNFNRFNLEGSYRYEKYNKFPNDFAWKVAGFFKILETEQSKWLARFSYSEGFRAPALQQLYYNRVQTVTTTSGVVNRGTFSPYSPVVRQLGIEPLKNETSSTTSIGSEFKKNLFEKGEMSFALDFYNVDIDDRIVLSGNLDSAQISDPNNEVRKILSQYNISSMNFFLNAVNTRSAGLDLRVNFKNDFLELSIGSNIALKNIIRHIAPPPKKIEETGLNIFNRREQSRLLTSRPANKTIAEIRYFKENKYACFFNGTYFGKVSWKHQLDSLKDQEFKGKAIFNIGGELKLNKNINMSININNLLNTKPDLLDPKGDANTNGGGRFKYYREVNQFGYIGRTYLLRLNFIL